jgi:hypothetical protein
MVLLTRIFLIQLYLSLFHMSKKICSRSTIHFTTWIVYFSMDIFKYLFINIPHSSIIILINNTAWLIVKKQALDLLYLFVHLHDVFVQVHQIILNLYCFYIVLCDYKWRGIKDIIIWRKVMLWWLSWLLRVVVSNRRMIKSLWVKKWWIVLEV